MKIKRFAQTVSLASLAVFMATANADATAISYSTNGAGTEFVSSGTDTLVSNNNPNSTLVFTPNVVSNSGVPSGLDLGDFELTCLGCTTSATTDYNPFVFDLVVTDTTDGATGEFIGTSSGGTVSSNSDTIVIYWTTSTPGSLQLGPGTVNAITGNFESTIFDKLTNSTVLGAPNSGTPAGDTTVQGQIIASTPEPATLALFGSGLLAIGFYGRKKLVRK